MVEKFDYYDAIAHLIPGTVACLFLLLTFDLLGIALPKLDLGVLANAGIGIAVAYTVGHLLQSIASSLEPLYYALWGGKPSIRLLLEKSQQFSDKQRIQLIDELTHFFNVQEKRPDDRRAERNFYQRLFERCMALCNRNKLGRVEAFNAIYGFHRVLLTTFLLGFVTYLAIGVLQRHGNLAIPSTKIQLLTFLLVSTGIGTWIEIFRARKRAYYYAREVLWMTSEYIRSTTSNSGGRMEINEKEHTRE